MSAPPAQGGAAEAGAEIVAGLKGDLARWREALAALPDGGGFDRQRTLLLAWIKEGARLVERLD